MSYGVRSDYGSARAAQDELPLFGEDTKSARAADLLFGLVTIIMIIVRFQRSSECPLLLHPRSVLAWARSAYGSPLIAGCLTTVGHHCHLFFTRAH